MYTTSFSGLRNGGGGQPLFFNWKLVVLRQKTKDLIWKATNFLDWMQMRRALEVNVNRLICRNWEQLFILQADLRLSRFSWKTQKPTCIRREMTEGPCQVNTQWKCVTYPSITFYTVPYIIKQQHVQDNGHVMYNYYCFAIEVVCIVSLLS